MNAVRLCDEVAQLIERSTRASGVPLHVEDTSAVEQVATILRGTQAHPLKREAAERTTTPNTP
jgi:hypothetical protein